MEKENFQTSKLERLSYGTFFLGQNILYAIVATFISTFMLNQGVSEGLVAVTLLVPKIWDAFNDPIFGVIMDKVKFKKGKFLPWLKISLVAIILSTLFLFFMPKGMTEIQMCIWAIIGYVAWDTSYTLCDAPIFALSTSMSENQNERTAILSVGRFFATIGAMVATLVIEAAYLPLGWRLLSVIICAFSGLSMAPVIFLAKERTHAELNEEKVTLKDLLVGFVENKMLLVFFTAYFLSGITNTVQYMIPIFSQYVLGNTGVGTILIGICIIPAIIISLLLPTLTKKFDKFYLYIASLVIFGITSAIQYFVGYNNIVLLYIITFFRGIGFSGMFVLVYFFTPDCVEYGHYKSGIRNEGVCFSFQTFATKIVVGLVNSIALGMLAILGFSAPKPEDAIQIVTGAGANGCWFTMTLFCTIGTLLATILLLTCYKLRDKDVQVMAKYNKGEISREECDRLLEGRYESKKEKSNNLEKNSIVKNNEESNKINIEIETNIDSTNQK